jgi:hypothetical protein
MASWLVYTGIINANSWLAHKGWEGQKPDAQDSSPREILSLSKTPIQKNG